jgi:hypothetical protein
VDCYVASADLQVYLDGGRAGTHKGDICNLFTPFCEGEWVGLVVRLTPGVRLILWNKNCCVHKYTMADLWMRF